MAGANPWAKKIATEKHKKATPSFSLATTPTENPFISKARGGLKKQKRAGKKSSATTPSRILSSGWKPPTSPRIVPKKYRWITPGMKLHVSWRADPAFGAGVERSFTGRVVRLDDWILMKSTLGVLCHMPLSMMTTVEEK